MLEHTSEGRMTTWSLEQLGQAMGSPPAAASVEDFRRDTEKHSTALMQQDSPFLLTSANHKQPLSKQAFKAS